MAGKPLRWRRLSAKARSATEDLASPPPLLFIPPPPPVHYFYQIQSVGHPEEYYTGSTDNLKARLDSHNAGRSPHTAKLKPWRVVTYHAFADR